MKTKLVKSFFVTIGLCGLLLLVACSVASITKIEFEVSPKNVYQLNDGQVDAKLKITYSDNKTQSATLDEAPGLGIKVTGRTFSTAGNYTLVVSYGSITASFEYTVVIGDEIDGLFDGKETRTEKNEANEDVEIEYYRISTPAQLSNIRFALSENFLLTQDIDLNDIDWVPIGHAEQILSEDGTKAHYVTTGDFTGILNGLKPTELQTAESQNWSIKNLKINPDQNDNISLFGSIKGSAEKRAVVKNIDLIDFNLVATKYNVSPLAKNANYIDIINVNTKGYLEGTSFGGIVGNSQYIKFENCSTQIKFKGTRAYSNDSTKSPNYSYNIILYGGGLALQFASFSTFVDEITVEIIDCETNIEVVEEYGGIIGDDLFNQRFFSNYVNNNFLREITNGFVNGTSGLKYEEFSVLIGKYVGQFNQIDRYVAKIKEKDEVAKYYLRSNSVDAWANRNQTVGGNEIELINPPHVHFYHESLHYVIYKDVNDNDKIKIGQFYTVFPESEE